MTVPRPFWTPLGLETPTGSQTFQLPPGGEAGKYNFGNGANMAHESAHVRDCLKKGLTESPLVTLEESIVMARIMETVRRQVGVTYPQDTA